MKSSKIVTGCLVLVVSYVLSAQSIGPSPWRGVWHGELDGQPGVTLTLAEDAGEVGGTVVFNMVSRQGGAAQVIGTSAHVLMHPRWEGKTLSFQVIRSSDRKQLQFAVQMIDNEKVVIKCLNCGDDSRGTELVKSRP